MSNPSVLTIRIPPELKDNVVELAREQGVSTNQFVMYILTKSVAEMQAQRHFDALLRDRSREDILAGFDTVMDKVQDRPPLDSLN